MEQLTESPNLRFCLAIPEFGSDRRRASISGDSFAPNSSTCRPTSTHRLLGEAASKPFCGPVAHGSDSAIPRQKRLRPLADFALDLHSWQGPISLWPYWEEGLPTPIAGGDLCFQDGHPRHGARRAKFRVDNTLTQSRSHWPISFVIRQTLAASPVACDAYDRYVGILESTY